MERTDAEEPTVAVADTVDLLTGILLAHPMDSPPRQLFDHFDLPVSTMLLGDGVRPPRAEGLIAAFDRVPPDRFPSFDDFAATVMHDPPSRTPAEPDGLRSLRSLFGALLEQPNPAASAIRAALVRRRVDADAVLGSYRDFLGERTSYAAFLAARHPVRAPVIELPEYQADQPRARRPPGGTDAELPDLIGITAEVEAFARLVAAKRLVPPLAVGLFGDWGSGKSYFLRSLQREVDALADDQRTVHCSESEPVFCRSIVQIEFNAWQYVEGDLWASLIEHLFRNLTPSGVDDDDLVTERQRYWIEQLEHAGSDRKMALREREELRDRQRVAAGEVERRRLEREVALAKLERQRREQPLVGRQMSPELRKTVQDAAERAGLAAVATEAEGLAGNLVDARETLRRAGPLLAPLRSGGWRYAAALVVVLLFTPVVSLVLDRLDLSAVTSAAGGVAWLLATAAGYVKIGSRYLTGALAAIQHAQQQLDAERAKTRAELDRTVEEAREALDKVERELQEAVDQERTLADDAAQLETELRKITPGRVLRDFITERLGSDDYSRHLGLPALVRRDLARLSRLITQHPGPDAAAKETDEHAIDRIVLYIDDLDRCPTQLVIKVLEAVHLLLAFPLFVVVVAVDSRWLEHSLREHFRQLSGEDAEPIDYLEKIFQVPFWVRPLGTDVRRQMLRGLVTPLLAAPATELSGPGVGTAAGELSAADRAQLEELITSFGRTAADRRRGIDAASMTVTADELALIGDVAGLLAPTPRSVKRFVNIYLVLRSIGRGRGWSVPADGQVLLLLAITSGMPELATDLFQALSVEPTPSTLEDLVSCIGSGPAADHQRDQLVRWLEENPVWKGVDLSGLADWLGVIQRFRFQRAAA
jgi:hypothetical protein